MGREARLSLVDDDETPLTVRNKSTHLLPFSANFFYLVHEVIKHGKH